MTTPRTAAGRALVAIARDQSLHLGHLPEPLDRIVARIEAEATAGAGLRAAVAEFLKRWDDPETYHRLPAVERLRAALAATPVGEEA
jgi:hypothetical protein